MSLQIMDKREYLAQLQARIVRNRQLVESVFLPLSIEARGSQPEPGEWSVDQCFQHLIVSFEYFLPNFVGALDKPERPNSDGMYRPSFWAPRLRKALFDPTNKYPTLRRNNPAKAKEQTAYPDVLERHLAQLDRLSEMVERAETADLQTMCWLFKFALLRYNLGDYLDYLVSHDELHLDQAKRALAVYEARAAVV